MCPLVWIMPLRSLLLLLLPLLLLLSELLVSAMNEFSREREVPKASAH